jgi:hypothetical protein
MSTPTISTAETHRGREWVDQAACRVADPRDFAPAVATSRSSQYDKEREARTATALRWCATCPVLAACARQADLNGEEGLWGASLRTKDHHEGRYVVDRLIEQAPASQRTSNRKAVKR